METTIRRPIINTRDEPHATADKYRRLHVIIGDANLSQASNYLKFGTTAMVLSLMEAKLAPQIEVHEPVHALQAISHDTSLTATVRLMDGRRVTALDIQWMYYEAAAKLGQETGGLGPFSGDGHTHEVLEQWESTLTAWATTSTRVLSSVEWLAKMSLLEGYRNRDGLEWDEPGSGSSTCNGPMSALKKACTTDASPANACRRLSTTRRSPGGRSNRRRTPGRISVVGVFPGSARTWPGPVGTR